MPDHHHFRFVLLNQGRNQGVLIGKIFGTGSG
jgi:hypothetical protein